MKRSKLDQEVLEKCAELDDKNMAEREQEFLDSVKRGHPNYLLWRVIHRNRLRIKELKKNIFSKKSQ